METKLLNSQDGSSDLNFDQGDSAIKPTRTEQPNQSN